MWATSSSSEGGQLPVETAMRVFRWLDPRSLALCELVCRAWRLALTDASCPLLHWLWRKVYERSLGRPSRNWRLQMARESAVDIRQRVILSLMYYREQLLPPMVSTGEDAERDTMEEIDEAIRADARSNMRAALANAIKQHHNVIVSQAAQRADIDWALIIEHPYSESLVDVAARAGNEEGLRRMVLKGGKITKSTIDLVLQGELSVDVLLWLLNQASSSLPTSDQVDANELIALLHQLGMSMTSLLQRAVDIESIELMSYLLNLLPSDAARLELLMETDRFTGRTVLHKACGQALSKVFQYLLTQGVSNVRVSQVYSAFINKQGSQGETALSIAINRGDIGMARQLLYVGADIELKTKAGESCLHLAVQRSDQAMVQLLLARGARPYEVKPETMETPLSIALSNLAEQSAQQLEEKFAIAKLLILSGGELSEGEKMAMLRLLIKQTDQSGVDLSEFLEKAILEALNTLFYSCKMDWRSLLSGFAQDYRNMELITRIVQTPSSILRFLVNEGLADGHTAGSLSLLVSALSAPQSKRHTLERVRILLKLGIDPNSEYSTEGHGVMQPIHFIAFGPLTIELLDVLHEHGADINAETGEGATVLHYHMVESRGRLPDEYLWFLKQKRFDFSKRLQGMNLVDFWRFLYPSSGPQLLLTELVRESEDRYRDSSLIEKWTSRGHTWRGS